MLFCKIQLRKLNLCNNNIKYAGDIKLKKMAYLVNCIFQILFFFLTCHGLRIEPSSLCPDSGLWLLPVKGMVVGIVGIVTVGEGIVTCYALWHWFIIVLSFFFQEVVPPGAAAPTAWSRRKSRAAPSSRMPGELAHVGSHCVSEIPPTPPKQLLSRWQKNHSNLNRLECCWPFCQ